MILDLYEELISYQEVGGDMVERLKKMGVYEVFEPLHLSMQKRKHDEGELFNKILFFIVRIYSHKSPELEVKGDILGIKLKVFEELELPESIKAEVVFGTDEGIQLSIYNYLVRQESVVFRHYLLTVDLYNQMLIASIGFPRDANGNVDYKRKFECNEQAKKLYKEMEEWKNKIEQEFGRLKEEKIKPRANDFDYAKAQYMGIEEYAVMSTHLSKKQEKPKSDEQKGNKDSEGNGEQITD